MISHQSLPEVVEMTLRRRILNNELVAGERLIEANLAAEFGVSRTTLRAALMELKNDRLVEFLPRRGCSVARMPASPATCWSRVRPAKTAPSLTTTCLNRWRRNST
jgi:DNA-binding GntR family transcriptional regulator